jgi:putative membrane protein
MKPYFNFSPRFFPTRRWVVRSLPFTLAVIGLAAPAPALNAEVLTDVTWGARLATDRLTASERAFLEQARESIRQQRRLGELGQSLARGTEVRAHAQKIVNEYRQMLERIEGLVRKKGTALLQPPEIPSESYQGLAAKSGPEFERGFVEILNELHERTLALFERAVADARDPDVRQFAAAQLPILREHHNRTTVLRKQFE